MGRLFKSLTTVTAIIAHFANPQLQGVWLPEGPSCWALKSITCAGVGTEAHFPGLVPANDKHGKVMTILDLEDVGLFWQETLDQGLPKDLVNFLWTSLTSKCFTQTSFLPSLTASLIRPASQPLLAPTPVSLMGVFPNKLLACSIPSWHLLLGGPTNTSSDGDGDGDEDNDDKD